MINESKNCAPEHVLLKDKKDFCRAKLTADMEKVVSVISRNYAFAAVFGLERELKEALDSAMHLLLQAKHKE